MIELWIVSDDVNESDSIISNAPTVPHVGSTIDTSQGIREIVRLHYDFHASNGECRVQVFVRRPER